ncbi:MAG: 1-phosphofructokinase family hexose kinase [Nocardioides sp.]
MIITLTANPSHDRTVALAGALQRGAVQRAASVISQAGGKGVNISRASVSAGVPTLAVLPAPKDDPFVHELLAAGIDCRPVAQPGNLRVNITISEPDGTTTKLNSPGPEMTDDTRAGITETLQLRAGEGDWVVLAGSLPPGAPVGWYADLVTALAHTGARVAVDTSDAPLQALVERLDQRLEGGAPHLMKPNGHELASFTGHDADSLEDDPVAAARAARDLVDRGVETVLVTLGGRGAVLVTGDGAWHAASPPTHVVSTVGAGDSSLFGYLLAAIESRPPADRLALAVAYGSAAAGLPGTTIPEPRHVDTTQVTVTDLDLSEGD